MFTSREMLPRLTRGEETGLSVLKKIDGIEVVLSHAVTTVQPLLHDADELLVAEFVVTILVEDLEDCVDQVVGQLDARSHVDRAGKLL